MASDPDGIHERLIEDLRPKLQGSIIVEKVLDHLHFIEATKKELIRQRARNEGETSAVNVLIDAVVKKPHQEGWFRAFVDALSHGGCKRAAGYLESNPPDAEAEAENDYCIRLIDVLAPTLVDMNTEQVCVHCHSKELLTEDDKETVSSK